MYATDFEFANRRLSDFNCITCEIDGNSGFNEVNVGCDITFNTVKNNHSSIHSKTSSSYESVYSTSFHICKNPCNGDDKYFTHEEEQFLRKWLNRHSYEKFKPLPNNDEYYDICYYGSFNVDNNYVAGKNAVLTLNFTGNAPYAFGENHCFQVAIGQGETFSIYGDSDETSYTIYPKVDIKCLADGDLEIINKTTNSSVFIGNCVKDEEITLDGEFKIIYSTEENGKHATLSNDFNYEYLDIEIGNEEDLENIYEVSLPCEIEISYSPIRKVGA